MKTHFVISEFSLVKGQTQTVLCGKDIEQAEVQPIWDDFATGSTFELSEATNLCPKCAMVLITDPEDGSRCIWAVTQKRKSEAE